MNKHFYPAIFHEESGGYWVEFPELPGCVTQGDNFEEAYEMAVEALGLYLETDNGFCYPDAIQIDKKQIDKDCYVVMVEFDEIEYLKKTENQSIKKTLTIPKWLDTWGIKNNVNFSQTLQNALIEKMISK